MSMYSLEALLDTAAIQAVATGHSAPVMRWEDTPNGRRMGSTPEVDEATNAPFRITDVIMPFGRDGKPELFGIRHAAHEEPDLTPYSPVELVGLRLRVWPSKTAKGIEVSFTADVVRPASTAPQRQGRRSSQGEAA